VVHARIDTSGFAVDGSADLGYTPPIMKTFLPCLIGPALMAGVGFFLHADDAVEKAATGKVLLLKNGQVVEGDIEKVGTQMRVRRGASEVWIAADLSARLCADWDDAYVFMQTLIKADSAGDQVRLARWCNMHHMNDRALTHAKLALQLQADHAGAKQIVTLLERSQREPGGKSSPVAASAPATGAAKSTETAFLDVTAETSIAFTSKVQPILMNTCASCHANGGGGKFALERVSEGGQKVASMRNLAAVLNYIDMDRPSISPLLVKAVTPHGASSPPIKDRSAKPFIALKDWLDLTIAKNPQLKEYNAAKKGSPAKSNSDRPRVGFGAQQSSATPAQPEWCDPSIFNDWAHPRAGPSQTANRR
jgi:hypothetical protein